jgi:hypothetical protein
MLNKADLKCILTTAAQQFSLHDSDIGRYLSLVLSDIEVKKKPNPPTFVEASYNVLPGILKSDKDVMFLKHISEWYQYLCWRHPGFGNVPPLIAERMAVVEVVGPTGMIYDERCRFGFLLQDRYVSNTLKALTQQFVLAHATSCDALTIHGRGSTFRGQNRRHRF